LDDFVDAFEAQVEAWADSPWALQSMALALSHAPRKRSVARALDLAGKAVEKTGRKDARFLAGLAAVQFAAGEEGRAIRTLEEASEQEFFDKVHVEQLGRYRKSLLPRVASMASLDAVLETGNQADLLDAATVDSALFAEEPGAAAEVEAYLEACRLEASGMFAEAAGRFGTIASNSKHPVRPTIRRVECLRAEGRLDEARGVLENAIAADDGGDRRLWDLWWLVEVEDLARAPDEIIQALPAERPETADLPGHRDDLAWLLGCLKAGAPLRIDSGLNIDHADPHGGVWSRDRFFIGGWRQTGQNKDLNPIIQPDQDRQEFREKINGAAYDRPYRTARHFPRLLLDSGYRIPVPPGTYRVTLHFADLLYSHPGRRKFDVFLEDQKVLWEYAPNRVGFATADIHAFTVAVSDGFLDLQLRRTLLVRRDPMISALEVERVD
jgi:tetratricopeptide (TPR) repeat protein